MKYTLEDLRATAQMAADEGLWVVYGKMLDQAADEIERLREALDNQQSADISS